MYGFILITLIKVLGLPFYPIRTNMDSPFYHFRMNSIWRTATASIYIAHNDTHIEPHLHDSSLASVYIVNANLPICENLGQTILNSSKHIGFDSRTRITKSPANWMILNLHLNWF